MKIKNGYAALPRANCSAHLLAEKIAAEILTIYGSSEGQFPTQECTRAQLMLRQKDGSERNMGERNKASIIEVIKRNLRDAGL